MNRIENSDLECMNGATSPVFGLLFCFMFPLIIFYIFLFYISNVITKIIAKIFT